MTSQSPTFIPSLDGAACLLGDFYFQGVEGYADAGRQGLGAGMHRGRLTVPRVSATRREVHVSGRFESGNVHHFTAPPRTTTSMQPGNYGNGWRFFQCSGIRDQTGVLETLPRASNTAAACFKGMGSFRLASQTGEPYTTRPAASLYCRSRRACGGPLPALAGNLLQP